MELDAGNYRRLRVPRNFRLERDVVPRVGDSVADVAILSHDRHACHASVTRLTFLTLSQTQQSC